MASNQWRSQLWSTNAEAVVPPESDGAEERIAKPFWPSDHVAIPTASFAASFRWLYGTRDAYISWSKDELAPKPMELMQLHMLIAAAEEKSLQKAAGRVSRTPQAVSMAIGKLEDEIGVLLFDRRGFRLTAEGGVLVDYARRSLSLLNEGLAAVGQVGTARRSRLRIGANQSIGEYLLPRLTHAFREKNPDVRLKIVIGFSEFILSAFRNGDMDVALVADRPSEKDLMVQPLMTDRLMAILNPRHPLAHQKKIQLKALGNQPLVLLTEASELRERVVETFQRFGIPLNLHVETGTLDSVKRMVAQNMGIGIVPSLCVMQEESANLIVKTIKEFPEDRCLWIVHALRPSAPCQAFVALLKSAVTSVK